jgi:hypothetical protein
MNPPVQWIYANKNEKKRMIFLQAKVLTVGHIVCGKAEIYLQCNSRAWARAPILCPHATDSLLFTDTSAFRIFFNQ